MPILLSWCLLIECRPVHAASKLAVLEVPFATLTVLHRAPFPQRVCSSLKGTFISQPVTVSFHHVCVNNLPIVNSLLPTTRTSVKIFYGHTTESTYRNPSILRQPPQQLRRAFCWRYYVVNTKLKALKM